MIKLSLFHRTLGGKFDRPITMGHTVILDELKGDIPSVLIIIPGFFCPQPLFKPFHLVKLVQFPKGKNNMKHFNVFVRYNCHSYTRVISLDGASICSTK